MFEVKTGVRPAIEPGIAPDEIRPKQPHATSDVPTNDVWINHPFGNESRTHWRTFAGVQIRVTHGTSDTFEFCDGIELSYRFTFDPTFG
jgi:hypothetical protein